MKKGWNFLLRQKYSEAGPGEPQNMVIYGLLYSTRPLIDWEAHECRSSMLNNRIVTNSEYQDTPCLMGGPDWFLRLQFRPGGHNLPKATEQ